MATGQHARGHGRWVIWVIGFTLTHLTHRRQAGRPNRFGLWVIWVIGFSMT